ncbi:hypothetical protein PCANC_12007 [Puccinia coronata f. sp. avenae]|uniref:Uncharacterized protein n=1 Tax=Puccinia coronata f. sp. avenae TaxID=200324 RepID=A0A2N5UUR1_9BASI|nr:hypothetical protein PCANC_12007 [Puccinia coronata f. sp. avenae]
MLSSSHLGSTASQAQQATPTSTSQAQQATPTPRMASGSSAGEQDLDTSSCCLAILIISNLLRSRAQTQGKWDLKIKINRNKDSATSGDDRDSQDERATSANHTGTEIDAHDFNQDSDDEIQEIAAKVGRQTKKAEADEYNKVQEFFDPLFWKDGDQRSITGVSGAETPIKPMEALLETSKPTGTDQPRSTKILEDVHLVPRP